jgi:hypothetical protein
MCFLQCFLSIFPKVTPKWLPKVPQCGPKVIPKWPKSGPRHVQTRPDTFFFLKNLPIYAQTRPDTPKTHPRHAQTRSDTPPRPFCSGVSSFLPKKTASEACLGVSGRVWGVFWACLGVSGHIFQKNGVSGTKSISKNIKKEQQNNEINFQKQKKT